MGDRTHLAYCIMLYSARMWKWDKNQTFIIRGSLNLPKELIKNYPNDSKRPISRFSFSMKNFEKLCLNNLRRNFYGTCTFPSGCAVLPRFLHLPMKLFKNYPNETIQIILNFRFLSLAIIWMKKMLNNH